MARVSRSLASRARRSTRGNSSRGSPSRSSTSNATKTVVPSPRCSNEKLERPFWSSAQISPSSTAVLDFTAGASARATCAKRAVRSLAFCCGASRGRRRPSRSRGSRPIWLEAPTCPAGQSVRERGEHRRVRTCLGCRVLAQEQPVLGLAVQVRRHECPDAVVAPAVEPTVKPPSRFSSRSSYVPVSQISTVPAPYCPSGSRPRTWRSRAGGPRHVPPGAARRPSSGNPLGHGPAREHTVPLEAQVVVQAPRGMPLDHEDRAAAGALSVERLRRPARISLAPIRLQAHVRIIPHETPS